MVVTRLRYIAYLALQVTRTVVFAPIKFRFPMRRDKTSRPLLLSGMQGIDICPWERTMGLRKATAMRTRVLIADDNAFVRTALYEFFDREPDFQVCALAENGKEAIEAASRRHPDL